MQITISFDPATLTDEDKAVLASLAGGVTAPTAEKAAPAAAPAAKAAPKAKAAPRAEEPVEEAEEVVEDDAPDADGATMEDAVALATKLVSSGQAAKVKAALAEAGAKRVSELGEDKIADFIASLS
jgi:hypothetical protein